jgi:O-antigen ligase
MTTNPVNPSSSTLFSDPATPRLSGAHWAWIAGILLLEAVAILALGVDGPALGVFIAGGLGFVALAAARPSAAWLAVIALVPFSMEVLIPGTDSAVQAPTEPMLLALLALWILRLLLGEKIHLGNRRLTWSVTGMLALAVLSSFYSEFSRASLKASVNFSWYVVFGYFISAVSLRTMKDLRRFPAVVSISAALVSLYYVQNIARTGLNVDSSNLAGLPFFTEHGTFAAYLCFAFPMAVLALLWARRSADRILHTGAAAAILAGILLSLTRAAWLGFAGSIATLIFYSLQSRRGRTVAAVVLILTLAVGGIGILRSASTLTQHAQSIVNVKTNISNLERFNRWAAAWDMFRAHPVGGVGFGVYKHHYYEFRRVRLATTESGPRAGAHSIYLSVLSETGVLGGIVAVVFAVAFFSTVRRTLIRCRQIGRRASPIAQMTIALTAGLVSYAIHGIFNYYPSWDKVNLPIWVFVGSVAVCARLVESAGSTDGIGRHAS